MSDVSSVSEEASKTSAGLLTARETSKEYGVPEATLTDWRYKGVGPPYVRVGPKAIRYRQRDFEAWLDANTIRPGAA